MSIERPVESLTEILARLFAGRRDVLGTYDPVTNRVWQEKRAVTSADYARHCSGEAPLGIYPLVADQVIFAAVDFDVPDQDLVLRFAQVMRTEHWHAHVERSKSKGFHCWFFFDQAAAAATVRTTLRRALTTLGAQATEVFPKQDRLQPGEFGNFINLPLFGRLVPEGKTVFVDARFEPIADQWAYLAGARLTKAPTATPTYNTPASPTNLTFTAAGTRGLMPCMQRMLAVGVTFNQRVSAYWLAVALRKAGLPQDAAKAVLLGWAPKNKPATGRRIITAPEICAQVQSAYRGRLFRGCGCEKPEIAAFCTSNCSLRRSGAVKP